MVYLTLAVFKIKKTTLSVLKEGYLSNYNFKRMIFFQFVYLLYYDDDGDGDEVIYFLHRESKLDYYQMTGYL